MTKLLNEGIMSKNEQRCLFTITQVLDYLGQPEIKFLSDINRYDGRIFHHQKELDVYEKMRMEGGIYHPFPAPFLQHIKPAGKATDKIEIFAYLKPQYPQLDRVLELLAEQSSMVCCPGMHPSKLREWQSKGLKIQTELLHLDKILPHCRLFIGHGGVGTFSNALSAGVPVLGLPIHMENLGTCMALKQAGLGDYIIPSSGNDGIAEALSKLLLDEEIRHQCQKVQYQYQDGKPQSLAEVMMRSIRDVIQLSS